MHLSCFEHRSSYLGFNFSVACAVCFLVLGGITPCYSQTDKPAARSNSVAAEKLFTLRVLPVLKVKCFGCHGHDPKDIRGDYDLLTREKMIAGGESGDVALIPGDPENSPLFTALQWDGLEMPPKENDRLSEAEIGYFRDWIKAGAPWPNEQRQKEIQKQEWSVRQTDEGLIVDTSGGLADDWTYRRYQPSELWAFQPVTRPELPNSNVHPVDHFIDQELAKADLTAAAQADSATLVRRATYDLTGLPPTPAEIKTFQKEFEDDPQAAWTNLIDRLLESSHYGERWAQHWLDIVRYADTAGFSNDYERSNAWRYRDYVIRAFNQDKPYNEFVLEQLAGDEYRPKDPEALIATGFLRMGPWGTAMIPQDQARQIYLDDLVHNVGQSFLSLPMRCCKCHDHKFDPIPTQDYYRMYSAFATTQPAEMPAPFLPEENRNGFAEKRKLVQELFNYAKSKRDAVINKQETAAKKWYAEHNLPYKNEQQRQNDPEDKKPPRHVGLTPAEQGIKKVREQDVWIWQRRLERFQPLAQAVYNGQDDWKNSRKLRPPKKINLKWRPANFILGGGSLEARLQPVTPGVISATGLNSAGEPVTNAKQADTKSYEITSDIQGRRLAFAKWVANDQNPLTARSIVNRVWQYHFGKGLVATANNFGAKGQKPTHPELLDWLTADFIENGWKLKRLHRLIMSSQTYQRSGVPSDLKKQSLADADNRMLSYFPPRRLTAEELRDSLLQVSGELNREMGGVPIMPEINMEVALQPRMIQFSIAPAHQPSRTRAERNRRTIYAYRVRGQADPFLEIMNLPNPNESCEMRDDASVSPQAFTLFNSDLMTDRSIAFALRIKNEQQEASNVSELTIEESAGRQIKSAFQLALGRTPTKNELGSLTDYLLKMQTYHQQHEPEKKTYPREVKRSLVEEFTGKPFVFIEKLNVFDDYEPDAKPWTVDAEVRALADVCLLLFNSNEFMFVY